MSAAAHQTKAFKYEVAFSFLATDEPLATQFAEALAPVLSCFVYSKRQEDIAGQDGMDAFTRVFLKDSRLNVILLRDGWGTTRFTRVEETAIKERVFSTGWDSLVVVTLDRLTSPPVWLPPSRLYMSLAEFGFRETAAVIRARAQDLGAIVHIETALERAVRLKRTQEAAEERAERLRRPEAERAAVAAIEELRATLDSLAAQARDQGLSIDTKQPSGYLGAVLTSGRTAITCEWVQPRARSVVGAELQVHDLEPGRSNPKHTTAFNLILSPQDEWGWHHINEGFLRPAELAEWMFSRLVDRIMNRQRGERAASAFRTYKAQ